MKMVIQAANGNGAWVRAPYTCYIEEVFHESYGWALGRMCAPLDCP